MKTPLHFRIFQKAVTWLVILSFLPSNYVFGVGNAPLAPLSDRFNKTDDAALTAGTLDIKELIDVNIPENFGTVKEKFKGPADKVIVHVQDSHCNFEAQTNFAAILKNLKTTKFKDDLNIIAVEGATGDIDLSPFDVVKDDEIKYKIAQYFMKEGMLTGAEYYALFDKKPMEIYGIENEKLYIENYTAFLKTQYYKKDALKSLEDMKGIIKLLRGKVFGPDMLEVSVKSSEYEDGKLKFTDYCQYLRSASDKFGVNWKRYNSFRNVIESMEIEGKTDMKAVNAERAEFITVLQKKMVKEELSELVKKSLFFRIGKISATDFYSYLVDAAQKVKLDTAKYPNFMSYVKIVKIHDGINPAELFFETDQILGDIKDKAIKTANERKFDTLLKNVRTTEKLLNLELTRDDLKYFNEHRTEINGQKFLNEINAEIARLGLPVGLSADCAKITDHISEMEAFYKAAIDRDTAIVENTLAKMEKSGQKAAVVVTGGFHSKGVMEKFKAKGISYIVVTPRMTAKYDPGVYMSRMMNEQTALEKLLLTAGTRLINPTAWAAKNFPAFSFEVDGKTITINPEDNKQHQVFMLDVLAQTLAELSRKDKETITVDMLVNIDALPIAVKNLLISKATERAQARVAAALAKKTQSAPAAQTAIQTAVTPGNTQAGIADIIENAANILKKTGHIDNQFWEQRNVPPEKRREIVLAAMKLNSERQEKMRQMAQARDFDRTMVEMKPVDAVPVVTGEQAKPASPWGMAGDYTAPAVASKGMGTEEAIEFFVKDMNFILNTSKGMNKPDVDVEKALQIRKKFDASPRKKEIALAEQIVTAYVLGLGQDAVPAEGLKTKAGNTLKIYSADREALDGCNVVTFPDGTMAIANDLLAPEKKNELISNLVHELAEVVLGKTHAEAVVAAGIDALKGDVDRTLRNYIEAVARNDSRAISDATDDLTAFMSTWEPNADDQQKYGSIPNYDANVMARKALARNVQLYTLAKLSALVNQSDLFKPFKTLMDQQMGSQNASSVVEALKVYAMVNKDGALEPADLASIITLQSAGRAKDAEQARALYERLKQSALYQKAPSFRASVDRGMAETAIRLAARYAREGNREKLFENLMRFNALDKGPFMALRPSSYDRSADWDEIVALHDALANMTEADQVAVRALFTLNLALLRHPNEQVRENAWKELSRMNDVQVESLTEGDLQNAAEQMKENFSGLDKVQSSSLRDILYTPLLNRLPVSFKQDYFKVVDRQGFADLYQAVFSADALDMKKIKDALATAKDEKLLELFIKDLVAQKPADIQRKLLSGIIVADSRLMAPFLANYNSKTQNTLSPVEVVLSLDKFFKNYMKGSVKQDENVEKIIGVVTSMLQRDGVLYGALEIDPKGNTIVDDLLTNIDTYLAITRSEKMMTYYDALGKAYIQKVSFSNPQNDRAPAVYKKLARRDAKFGETVRRLGFVQKAAAQVKPAALVTAAPAEYRAAAKDNAEIFYDLLTSDKIKWTDDGPQYAKGEAVAYEKVERMAEQETEQKLSENLPQGLIKAVASNNTEEFNRIAEEIERTLNDLRVADVTPQGKYRVLIDLYGIRKQLERALDEAYGVTREGSMWPRIQKLYEAAQVKAESLAGDLSNDKKSARENKDMITLLTEISAEIRDIAQHIAGSKLSAAVVEQAVTTEEAVLAAALDTEMSYKGATPGETLSDRQEAAIKAVATALENEKKYTDVTSRVSMVPAGYAVHEVSADVVPKMIEGMKDFFSFDARTGKIVAKKADGTDGRRFGVFTVGNVIYVVTNTYQDKVKNATVTNDLASRMNELKHETDELNAVDDFTKRYRAQLIEQLKKNDALLARFREIVTEKLGPLFTAKKLDSAEREAKIKAGIEFLIGRDADNMIRQAAHNVAILQGKEWVMRDIRMNANPEYLVDLIDNTDVKVRDIMMNPLFNMIRRFGEEGPTLADEAAMLSQQVKTEAQRGLLQILMEQFNIYNGHNKLGQDVKAAYTAEQMMGAWSLMFKYIDRIGDMPAIEQELKDLPAKFQGVKYEYASDTQTYEGMDLAAFTKFLRDSKFNIKEVKVELLSRAYKQLLVPFMYTAQSSDPLLRRFQEDLGILIPNVEITGEQKEQGISKIRRDIDEEKASIARENALALIRAAIKIMNDRTYPAEMRSMLQSAIKAATSARGSINTFARDKGYFDGIRSQIKTAELAKQKAKNEVEVKRAEAMIKDLKTQLEPTVEEFGKLFNDIVRRNDADPTLKMQIGMHYALLVLNALGDARRVRQIITVTVNNVPLNVKVDAALRNATDYRALLDYIADDELYFYIKYYGYAIENVPSAGNPGKYFSQEGLNSLFLSEVNDMVMAGAAGDVRLGTESVTRPIESMDDLEEYGISKYAMLDMVIERGTAGKKSAGVVNAKTPGMGHSDLDIKKADQIRGKSLNAEQEKALEHADLAVFNQFGLYGKNLSDAVSLIRSSLNGEVDLVMKDRSGNDVKVQIILTSEDDLKLVSTGSPDASSYENAAKTVRVLLPVDSLTEGKPYVFLQLLKHELDEKIMKKSHTEAVIAEALLNADSNKRKLGEMSDRVRRSIRKTEDLALLAQLTQDWEEQDTKASLEKAGYSMADISTIIAHARQFAQKTKPIARERYEEMMKGLESASYGREISEGERDGLIRGLSSLPAGEVKVQDGDSAWTVKIRGAEFRVMKQNGKVWSVNSSSIGDSNLSAVIICALALSPQDADLTGALSGDAGRALLGDRGALARMIGHAGESEDTAALNRIGILLGALAARINEAKAPDALKDAIVDARSKLYAARQTVEQKRRNRAANARLAENEAAQQQELKEALKKMQDNARIQFKKSRYVSIQPALSVVEEALESWKNNPQFKKEIGKEFAKLLDYMKENKAGKILRSADIIALERFADTYEKQDVGIDVSGVRTYVDELMEQGISQNDVILEKAKRLFGLEFDMSKLHMLYNAIIQKELSVAGVETLVKGKGAAPQLSALDKLQILRVLDNSYAAREVRKLFEKEDGGIMGRIFSNVFARFGFTAKEMGKDDAVMTQEESAQLFRDVPKVTELPEVAGLEALNRRNVRDGAQVRKIVETLQRTGRYDDTKVEVVMTTKADLKATMKRITGQDRDDDAYSYRDLDGKVHILVTVDSLTESKKPYAFLQGVKHEYDEAVLGLSHTEAVLNEALLNETEGARGDLSERMELVLGAMADRGDEQGLMRLMSPWNEEQTKQKLIKQLFGKSSFEQLDVAEVLRLNDAVNRAKQLSEKVSNAAAAAIARRSGALVDDAESTRNAVEIQKVYAMLERVQNKIGVTPELASALKRLSFMQSVLNARDAAMLAALIRNNTVRDKNGALLPVDASLAKEIAAAREALQAMYDAEVAAVRATAKGANITLARMLDPVADKYDAFSAGVDVSAVRELIAGTEDAHKDVLANKVARMLSALGITYESGGAAKLWDALLDGIVNKKLSLAAFQPIVRGKTSGGQLSVADQIAMLNLLNADRSLDGRIRDYLDDQAGSRSLFKRIMDTVWSFTAKEMGRDDAVMTQDQSAQLFREVPKVTELPAIAGLDALNRPAVRDGAQVRKIVETLQRIGRYDDTQVEVVMTTKADLKATMKRITGQERDDDAYSYRDLDGKVHILVTVDSLTESKKPYAFLQGVKHEYDEAVLGLSHTEAVLNEALLNETEGARGDLSERMQLALEAMARRGDIEGLVRLLSPWNEAETRNNVRKRLYGDKAAAQLSPEENARLESAMNLARKLSVEVSGAAADALDRQAGTLVTRAEKGMNAAEIKRLTDAIALAQNVAGATQSLTAAYKRLSFAANLLSARDARENAADRLAALIRAYQEDKLLRSELAAAKEALQNKFTAEVEAIRGKTSEFQAESLALQLDKLADRYDAYDLGVDVSAARKMVADIRRASPRIEDAVKKNKVQRLFDRLGVSYDYGAMMELWSGLLNDVVLSPAYPGAAFSLFYSEKQKGKRLDAGQELQILDLLNKDASTGALLSDVMRSYVANMAAPAKGVLDYAADVYNWIFGKNAKMPGKEDIGGDGKLSAEQVARLNDLGGKQVAGTQDEKALKDALTEILRSPELRNDLRKIMPEGNINPFLKLVAEKYAEMIRGGKDAKVKIVPQAALDGILGKGYDGINYEGKVIISEREFKENPFIILQSLVHETGELAGLSHTQMVLIEALFNKNPAKRNIGELSDRMSRAIETMAAQGDVEGLFTLMRPWKPDMAKLTDVPQSVIENATKLSLKVSDAAQRVFLKDGMITPAEMEQLLANENADELAKQLIRKLQEKGDSMFKGLLGEDGKLIGFADNTGETDRKALNEAIERSPIFVLNQLVKNASVLEKQDGGRAYPERKGLLGIKKDASITEVKNLLTRLGLNAYDADRLIEDNPQILSIFLMIHELKNEKGALLLDEKDFDFDNPEQAKIAVLAVKRFADSCRVQLNFVNHGNLKNKNTAAIVEAAVGRDKCFSDVQKGEKVNRKVRDWLASKNISMEKCRVVLNKESVEFWDIQQLIDTAMFIMTVEGGKEINVAELPAAQRKILLDAIGADGKLTDITLLTPISHDAKFYDALNDATSSVEFQA